MKNADAIKLFIRRELGELLGRGKINLILLGGIFFLSIGVIGFGAASMRYLDYKMNDPFINWVDINLDQQGTDRNLTLQYLSADSVQQHFRFVDPQPNYVHYRTFGSADGQRGLQFDGRSITAWSTDKSGGKVENPIVEKILSPENTIVKRSLPLNDRDLGVIITAEMAQKLGYSGNPAFVALWQNQDTASCSEVGLSPVGDGRYAVYVPVIAIVRQLPGMNAFLFTNRYWREIYSLDAFCLYCDDCNEELLLCSPDEDYLEQLAQQASAQGFRTAVQSYEQSWREQSCLHISMDDYTTDVRTLNDLFAQLGVDPQRATRIYKFPDTRDDGGRAQYCSVRMLSLDSIRSFSDDIYRQCGIKLEMTNIESKDNFNFVQRMGVTLSICIIGIVAVFILVFIYYLLQSHFQKIRRNLGTFKAFGVDKRTLGSIYTVLMLILVLASFLAGGLLALIVATVWQLFGSIEAGYPWVDVLVWWNAMLLGITIVAAIVATWRIVNTTLCKTPGDLIYDR